MLQKTQGAPISNDETTRSGLEQLLSASEADRRWLQAVIDAVPIAVLLFSPSGRIHFNRCTEELLGKKLDPEGGREQYQDLIRYPDASEVAWSDLPSTRTLVHGETLRAQEFLVVRPDGTMVPVLASSAPVLDSNGARIGGVGVFQDVTEMIAKEKALERALRERDRVLGIVSHDLRSPIASITLAAHLLCRRAERDGITWFQEPLARITRSARLMTRLIADLLDVASIHEKGLSVHLEEISPSDLVYEIVNLLSERANEAGVTLIAETSPSIQNTLADYDRLVQVLTNLVCNALRFTPSGGRVAVRVVETDGSICFSVTDTGSGIPPEKQAGLFDRFWKTDPDDPKSRGMGLAIAKGIVEAHGGQIWVESEPGHGATFSFILPRRALAVAA